MKFGRDLMRCYKVTTNMYSAGLRHRQHLRTLKTRVCSVVLLSGWWHFSPYALSFQVDLPVRHWVLLCAKSKVESLARRQYMSRRCVLAHDRRKKKKKKGVYPSNKKDNNRDVDHIKGLNQLGGWELIRSRSVRGERRRRKRSRSWRRRKREAGLEPKHKNGREES